MSAEVVAESSAEIIVSFFDTAGAAETPATVSYMVRDMTTGRVVRADTGVTPGPSVAIHLSPTDTALQRASDHSERRRVIVTATNGAGEDFIDTYDFDVRNPAL